MTLTDQIGYLRNRIAEHREQARIAADIPMLRDRLLADAAALAEIERTLVRERERLRDHMADWS